MDNLSDYVRTGRKVAWVTIIINLILALSKLIIGYLYSSQGLVADGFHSATDVLSTFVVLITINISAKPADENHPYGHGKVEDIGSKILGIVLFLTALYIIRDSILKIAVNDMNVIVGRTALLAAFLSIIVKEWMFRYTIRAGKRLENRALIADAWHHRTDALSSVASLTGLGGAYLGLKLLDPLAGITVGLMIGYKALEILKESIENLMDTSQQELIKRVSKYIKKICMVREIRDIRCRKYGWRNHLDITIAVSSNLSVGEGHDVATYVQKSVIDKFDEVSGVFVHIEPVDDEGKQMGPRL